MGLLKDLLNLAHGSRLHKRFESDAAVPTHLQNRRVFVRRAAQVPKISALKAMSK
jgi:hypothetical protein